MRQDLPPPPSNKQKLILSSNFFFSVPVRTVRPRSQRPPPRYLPYIIITNGAWLHSALRTTGRNSRWNTHAVSLFRHTKTTPRHTYSSGESNPPSGRVGITNVPRQRPLDHHSGCTMKRKQKHTNHTQSFRSPSVGRRSGAVHGSRMTEVQLQTRLVEVRVPGSQNKRLRRDAARRDEQHATTQNSGTVQRQASRREGGRGRTYSSIIQ